MYLVPLAVLIVACNLCVMTAIGAGRALTGWARARWLIAEVVMYAIVFWASAHTFVSTSGILVLVALVLGFVIGVPLSFAESALAGHRSRFGTDLRSSLWLGRFADPFCAGAPYPERTRG
ncbi:MAG: hypothetical protein ACYDAL_07720 [Candidatus Dormibacteraceae bacterium]